MNIETRIAYWATIELYRTYLFEDGPFLQTIADEQRMSSETLSQIARSYSVSRTIPAPPESVEKTRNLDLFAAEILRLEGNWPQAFLDRAKECREAARRLNGAFVRRPGKAGSKPRTQGAPHSAVTKLIWFLKPDGWTVYDRYAADAVLKSGGNTEERQKRFYETIEGPLAHWSDVIRPIISPLAAGVHAERLLDKFLVLSGLDAHGRQSAKTRNVHFLRLLPEKLSARVRDTSEEVARCIPDDAFPREARAKRTKQSKVTA